MNHLGDITKIDGHKVPLVDVICGGSPCQVYPWRASEIEEFPITVTKTRFPENAERRQNG